MKNLLIITALLFVFNASSQNVQLGSPFDKETAEVVDILGTAKGKTYVTTYDGKSFYLNRFTNNVMQDLVVKMELPKAEGKKIRFLRAYLVKGQLSILGLSDDEKTKELTVVSYRLNEGNEIDPNYQLVGLVPVEKRDVFSEFKITFSSDSSQVLFYHNTPIDKGRQVRSSFILCNSKFEPIVSGNKLFTKAPQDIFMGKYAVNKHGDFCLQSNLINVKGTDVVMQQYRFTSFDKTGMETGSYLVPDELTFLYEGSLTYAGKNEKDLLATAYYKDLTGFKSNSALPEDDYVHGIIQFKWSNNAASKVYSVKSKFADDVYNMCYSSKDLTKMKDKDRVYLDFSESGLMQINDYIITTKGITVIAEQVKLGGEELKGAIWVHHFNPQGALQWTQKINKNQVHVATIPGDGMIEYDFDIYMQLENKQATGYFLTSSETQIELAFYGDSEATSLPLYESVKAESDMSKLSLITYSIDYTGKKKVKSTKEEFGPYSPKLARRIDANTFRVSHVEKKNNTLGILKF